MKFSVSTLLVGLVASVDAAGRINRVPDSEWDHILRGSDLLSQRSDEYAKTDGYLVDYDLRSRVVDPSALKVDTVKQLSGYIDDNANDKHLFFWFFESRNDPAKDPVVLWLNGGPGCSSMNGLFTELGPATIPNRDLKPVRNNYSWNNNASVIFIDQPVNTGFSYSGSNDGTSVAGAKDLYALLTFFFKQYPQYAKQDFHISGESYAGHYIPVTASEILSHANRNINLKSILVGNGLTEPLTQYKYYRPMACGEGGYPAVLGQSDCRSMDNALPECQKRIKACYDTENDRTCQSATNYCNGNVLGVYGRSGRNNYDIRKRNGEGTPDYVTEFLTSNRTTSIIGAEHEWELCDGSVYQAFANTGDWMKPIWRVVPDLLAKIPVLIYAGDADYICNWLGNRAWTKALEWPGKAAFNKAPEQPLKLGGSGKEYGKVTHSGNFNFMQIYAAGHMVPEDQPVSSLDFFNRWIAGEWKN
ncbi:carboxypeptidase Y [Akanthomyces lecanii RCEF 1005]|uniref:Carboxypeptidase n=1 Tax=Akanthomyces lecanii RCEF 1005 TaxID=1081108 RepID=A0A168I1K0_CORDF|nr:carboxypeptidase Y [Akanthomyces lecanii RCEF 1005]